MLVLPMNVNAKTSSSLFACSIACISMCCLPQRARTHNVIINVRKKVRLSDAIESHVRI